MWNSFLFFSKIEPFVKYIDSEITGIEIFFLLFFKKAIEASYKSSAKKPGLIATSGLEYTVDPKKGKLIELKFIDSTGEEHEIDIDNPSVFKTYKVVADEFLMSAGADYEKLADEDQYIQHLPYDKDFIVCEYLKKHPEPIVIEHSGRITFESDDD